MQLKPNSLLLQLQTMEFNSDETGGTTTISAVHEDITATHILTRLDGPSLASAATTCSQLHALSSHDHLWSNICYSTWPSTNTPRVQNIISTFPHGYRSFFSDSFPTALTAENPISNPDRTSELISSVDLFLKEQLILSKVAETETVTGWFRCWPFRVDLLDPKDSVQTAVNYPIGDDTCRLIGEELKLSWIVIDPAERRAVNVSSRSPVSVRRHWLTGEMEVLFTTVVESAVCKITVMCGGGDGGRGGGRMQVKEVSMHMEDMDGKQMNGRDSLVILKKVLEGKRVKSKKEGKEEYLEFEKKKKERKERKMKRERRLDMLCLFLVTTSFLALSSLFLF